MTDLRRLRDLSASYKDVAMAPTISFDKTQILDRLMSLLEKELTKIEKEDEPKPEPWKRPTDPDEEIPF